MQRFFSILCLAIFAIFILSLQIYSQEPCAQKLQKIIVDKVVFDETDVIDAFEFLRKYSKEKDPEGKGINIVLRELKKGENKITLELSDIPASELIRYICIAAKLDYKVEQFAVIISKKDEMKK